jgi:hypothetical protein
MRDFLDSILLFIGSASLSDNEFESIELEEPVTYTKETYEALKVILENREGVSGQQEKLRLFFLSKGIDLSESPKAYIPNSNIFIGVPL